MKLNTDWHDEYLASYARGEASTHICERLGIPASAPWSHEDQNHNDFASRISKAREARAHALADQMLMISDDDSGDTFVDAQGVERSSFENVQRSRLAVDTRKYLTGKLFSRFYGERIGVAFGEPLHHDGPLPLDDPAAIAGFLVERFGLSRLASPGASPPTR